MDLDAAEWRIPAQRMKMRERHIVPLSTQAVALLQQLRRIARKSRYVFPSLQSRDRPMSVNTVNGALRRLGYERDEMTAHGFRAMACTCLNELGWHPDLIELQLAHAERNKVRAAYNRAERLADRRKMMQAWGDYLDGLRAGKRKTSINDVTRRRSDVGARLDNQPQGQNNSPKINTKGEIPRVPNWSYSSHDDGGVGGGEKPPDSGGGETRV